MVKIQPAAKATAQLSNEVEVESTELIKMIDVLGREYNEHKNGMLLFYIYENGKVEKRVIH